MCWPNPQISAKAGNALGKDQPVNSLRSPPCRAGIQLIKPSLLTLKVCDLVMIKSGVRETEAL